MTNKLKTIPLSQLRRSPRNVRKTDRMAGIKALAANIQQKGLLENLVVRPIKDATGDHTHEVTAGGRRLAALQWLVRRKKLPGDHPVPCLVRIADEGDTIEVSLAENFLRADLHPADQFEAFAARIAEGGSPAEVGARFGVTETFVRQRLKLAAVSPRLIAAYRKAEMTLDQLTAFTIADDHAAQEAVWFGMAYADLAPQTIRRLLTQAQVESTDRRARFIGVKAYEAAGGTIVRDLFDAEDEGYFSDSQLLDRLVAEKLDAAAEPVRSEGWQWVEVHPDADAIPLYRFERARTVARTPTSKEEKRLASLDKRHDALVAKLEEDDSDSKAVETLDSLAREIAALEASLLDWPDDEKANAGAIVSLGHDGEVRIVRGLVRPGPDQAETGAQGSVRKVRTKTSGYPESLVLDLSAHRTAALRETLAGRPEIALTALLHVLVGRLFHRGISSGCIAIVPTEFALHTVSETVEDSAAAQAFAVRHAAWCEQVPNPEHLWTWLEQLDGAARLALLAHCLAMTINALDGPSSSAERRSQVERLSTALNLDMVPWWRPTRRNFLDRVTKQDILNAVSEGVSQQAANRIASLKKDAMAAEAERLLKDTGWLPAPLRASHSANDKGEQ